MYHKYREAAVGSITVQPPAPVSPVPPTCRTLRPRPSHGSVGSKSGVPPRRRTPGVGRRPGCRSWAQPPELPILTWGGRSQPLLQRSVGQPLQTHLLRTRACEGTRGPRCISAAWQVWRCPAGSPVFVERMRTGTSLLLCISRAVVEPRVFRGKHTDCTHRRY